jgi:hypothetical protein
VVQVGLELQILLPFSHLFIGCLSSFHDFPLPESPSPLGPSCKLLVKSFYNIHYSFVMQHLSQSTVTVFALFTRCEPVFSAPYSHPLLWSNGADFQSPAIPCCYLRLPSPPGDWLLKGPSKAVLFPLTLSCRPAAPPPKCLPAVPQRPFLLFPPGEARQPALAYLILQQALGLLLSCCPKFARVCLH